MHEVVNGEPERTFFQLILDWAPQVNFHWCDDEDEEHIPTTDGHHLMENDVLSPHGVVLIAQQCSCWIVKIERDVRDEHPWEKP